MKNERALEAFLFWFYIHFIDRGCQWCYNECIQLLFQSDVIPISEGSLRLDILLSVPPLFLFNRLLKMMEGFMYLICSCSHSNSPYLEDSSCAKTWVLPSCYFFSPFVECFVLSTIGRCSSDIWFISWNVESVQHCEPLSRWGRYPVHNCTY
jgi:hypothetical protein